MQDNKLLLGIKEYIQKIEKSGGSSSGKGASNKTTALVASVCLLIAVVLCGILFMDDIKDMFGLSAKPAPAPVMVREPVAASPAANEAQQQADKLMDANNGAINTRNMDRITELMADTELKKLELENLKLATELKKVNRDLNLIRTVTMPGYPNGGAGANAGSLPGMEGDINPEFPQGMTIVPPVASKSGSDEEEEEKVVVQPTEPSGVVLSVYGKGKNLIAMVQTPNGKFRLKRGDSVPSVGTIESISVDKVTVNFGGKSFILPWE